MSNLAWTLILELDYEAIATRKLLARIPDEHFDWKPHPKSMAIGELGCHIAESFLWVDGIVDRDEFEMDPETYTPWRVASSEELVAGYNRLLDAAKAKIGELSDERLHGLWTMKVAGQTLLQLPRIAVVKTFLISHQIHHRGQLDVYLRLLDIPLPQIYGPSADEPDMPPRVDAGD